VIEQRTKSTLWGKQILPFENILLKTQDEEKQNKINTTQQNKINTTQQNKTQTTMAKTILS
jgi:hypothetical protein